MIRGVRLGLVLMAMASFPACNHPERLVPGPVEILQADQGREIHVPIGEIVRVRLRSIPTAGYVWHLARPLPAFLEPVGEETLPTSSAQSQPGFVGGEHWLVFAYKPTAKGRAELVFHEGRPWELNAGTKPSDTFRVTLIVQ